MPNSKCAGERNSTVKVTAITTELCTEVFCDAFRRHVGLGKRWSVRDLAEATGIDSRTLESYRDGKNPPNLPRFQRLVAVLGEEFGSEAMRPTAMAFHSIGHVGMDGYKLTAEVGSKLADFTRYLDDGVIDASESREMVPLVRELHAACCRFLAHQGGFAPTNKSAADGNGRAHTKDNIVGLAS